MKHATTRVLIETMLRKAIRDIKDSPKRSTRNMIDMALNFSDGRFQKHFFQSAQKMLKNEQSAYYTLVLDAVNHIDEERLIGFGINLGYNGCTVGAKRIREIEEHDCYDIPWTIALMIDTTNYSLHEAAYRSLVEQGKTLGIYAWQLCVSGDPDVLIPLVESNKDCAFTILCDPETVTEEFLEDVYHLNHVMLVVRFNEETARVCSILRERQMLYSVFMTYTEADIDEIINGEYFLAAEELHPVFTMLIAKSSCPLAVREQVYKAVTDLRAKQTMKSIPWEITYDASFVDSVISNEPCSVLFDEDGYLHNWYSRESATEYNFFHSDLVSILKLTQTKKQQK